MGNYNGWNQREARRLKRIYQDKEEQHRPFKERMFKRKTIKR